MAWNWAMAHNSLAYLSLFFLLLLSCLSSFSTKLVLLWGCFLGVLAGLTSTSACPLRTHFSTCLSSERTLPFILYGVRSWFCHSFLSSALPLALLKRGEGQTLELA